MARRYAARRDNNDATLAKLARDLGATLIQAPPLDYWCGFRERWLAVVEIKRPDKEGWKNEYTPDQIKTLILLKERGLPVWTWRVENDVLKSLGAIQTA